MTDEQIPEDEQSPREDLTAETADVGDVSLSPTEDEAVKRNPTTIAVTAVVVLAIIAIGIWAVMSMMRPDPRALIQETVANYQNAEQIHVESSVAYFTVMGEDENETDLPTSAWFTRPNKMYFKTGVESQETSVVSDGESLYLEIGMFGGVIKLPAPETFAEMPLNNLSISSGAGIQNMKLPDIASILSGEFAAEDLTAVAHGIHTRHEWLNTMAGPEGTWPVTIQAENGPSVALWVDKQQRVVRKFATVVDYETMLATNPEIEEQLQQLEAEDQEAVRQMVSRIEGNVQTVELGQEPPEGTYAYEPPADAQVVEADTIEQGIQKLMTVMMEQQGMPGGPMPDGAPAEE